MSAYGTLTDWTTNEPLRAATRDEWEMTAHSIDLGEPEGAWRDPAINSGPVYVDGGPDPFVSDQAIRDFGDESARFGDMEQVATCGRALGGDKAARDECVALIRDYRCREAEALEG